MEISQNFVAFSEYMNFTKYDSAISRDNCGPNVFDKSGSNKALTQKSSSINGEYVGNRV